MAESGGSITQCSAEAEGNSGAVSLKVRVNADSAAALAVVATWDRAMNMGEPTQSFAVGGADAFRCAGGAGDQWTCITAVGSLSATATGPGALGLLGSMVPLLVEP